MRVAYLGPPGTFSEEAVTRCATLAGAERMPFPSFADAYEADDTGAQARTVTANAAAQTHSFPSSES